MLTNMEKITNWKCMFGIQIITDLSWRIVDILYNRNNMVLILAILFTCSQRHLYYMAFQSFDFERTLGRLFQKRVVRIKLDI